VFRLAFTRWFVFASLGLGAAAAVLANSWVATLVADNPTRALAIRPHHPEALLARAEALLDEVARRDGSESSGGSGSVAGGAIGARRDRWVVPSEPSEQTATGNAARGDSGNPRASPPPSEEEQRAQAMAARARALAEVGDNARLVLAQRPGDPHALRILGIAALEAKEESRAATLLRAAAARSLREAPALAWLVEEAARRDDWSALIERADVLLRMHPRFSSALIPALSRMAEHPQAAPLLRAAVLQNPPWRARLLSEMGAHVADVRTPLALLLALRETATPPTPQELGAYLSVLLRKGSVDVAYYTWLQFLPPEALSKVGYLYNGSFETRPSGLPFDWVIPSRGTATVEIARRSDRPQERALVIEMRQGRIEFSGITQLVRLIPGRYRFSSEGMGEVGGTRGFRWRIECASGRRERLGESPMLLGAVATWRNYAFDFTVPMQDCPLQTVRLDLDARMHSERLVTGTAWFDDLTISRLPATAEAAPAVDGAKSPPQSQPRQR
jgi:hypothetical protein